MSENICNHVPTTIDIHVQILDSILPNLILSYYIIIISLKFTT